MSVEAHRQSRPDTDAPGPSARGAALAAELRTAAADLIAVVERIDPEGWNHVHKPGQWSPGKDAEHAADAAALHLSHVLLSLGKEPAPTRPIERARLTAVRSQAEVARALRTIAEDAARLLEGLSDVELERQAKPPRKPPRTVADIAARPLIRHLTAHRQEIELKLRAAKRRG